jgi:Fur family transcriptional regulator, ferric uptake regulator
MSMTKTHTHNHIQNKEARLTKGARKVLQALQQVKTLAAAQDIYSRMRSEDDDAPGLTTVYRSLDLLVAQGLAQAVELGDGEKRYELINPGEHHHHLICSLCKESVHLDQCLVEDIDSMIESKYGFEVSSHILEVFGTCKRCLDKKAKK